MSQTEVKLEATFNKEAFDKALREFYENPENLLEQSPLIQRIRLDNERAMKGDQYDWFEFDTAKQMYEPDLEKPGWKKVDVATVRLGPDIEYRDDSNEVGTMNVAAKFWKMEQRYSDVSKGDLDPDGAFVIALGYSVPDHWPVGIQTACKRWFSMYGKHLHRDSEGEWYRRPDVGGISIKLTFEDVAGCVLTQYPGGALQDNEKDSD